jgi:hypothetical protein
VKAKEWREWWKRRGETELRALLMTEWDPIGIAQFPEAADEYDNYLGPIASRLSRGTPVADVGRDGFPVAGDSDRSRHGFGAAEAGLRSENGRTWDRTRDLSRVKRALSR